MQRRTKVIKLNGRRGENELKHDQNQIYRKPEFFHFEQRWFIRGYCILEMLFKILDLETSKTAILSMYLTKAHTTVQQKAYYCTSTALHLGLKSRKVFSLDRAYPRLV